VILYDEMFVKLDSGVFLYSSMIARLKEASLGCGWGMKSLTLELVGIYTGCLCGCI